MAPPLPCAGVVECLAQAAELGFAAAQCRRRGVAELLAGIGWLQPDEAMYADRLREALGRLHAERHGVAIEPDQMEGGIRHRDRAGLGHMFQAACQMDRRAIGALLAGELDGHAGDDLAGVDADAHDDVLLGERAPHRKRGLAGPERVVLVGPRGAEQGHQPVAHRAHDLTVKLVDGRAHAGECRRQVGERRFRVEVADQFGRADDVGKEHADHLALCDCRRAFERLAAEIAEPRG